MLLMTEGVEFVTEDTTVTHYRDRNEKLTCFYKRGKKLCFCSDVNGLMKYWRLFIDSSKASLKGMCSAPHGNKKPSVPIVHAVGLKATYVEILLQMIN